MTEVYSISGEGEDNGAVYCEMQGRENSVESRATLELLRNIYPEHGYSKETGGIMKEIRENLSIDTIRKYHHRFYRPENLAVIVAGQVDIDEIEKALKPIDVKILKRKNSYPEFEKPWQTPVKPLKQSKDIKILFPSDEEESGLVHIGFLGPKATTEYETLTACYTLLKYLCETSVSPVQQSFIEIDEPFASRVGFNINENSTSLLYLSFENVPVAKIDFIYERLIQLLVDIANGKDPIDENRLKIVFEKFILERVSSLENSPHDYIGFNVIGDFLYGHTDDDFEQRLNVTSIIRRFQEYPIDYWLNVLRKYFVDSKQVVVRAFPSIAEKERLAKEEIGRLKIRRMQFGEEGLARMGQELSAAMAKNDIPPPPDMLTSLPVPSTKSISYHKLDVYKKTDDTKLDLNELPFYIEVYDIKSNFIYVTVAFDTSQLPFELRKYLLLFLDLIIESPVKISEDEIIPYEAVVASLEEDMISYETSMGLQNMGRFGCGPFSNTVTFHMQLEVKKLKTGIDWMSKLVFNSVFTQERIHILASKLINDVATTKRDGYEMARELMKAMFYKPETNVQQNSCLTQYQFLTKLLDDIKTADGLENIIDNLNKLRKLLIPSMTVQMGANMDKISSDQLKVSFETLSELIQGYSPIDHLPVTFDSQLIDISGISLNDGDEKFTGTIVGIGCVESGYLFQSSPGILSFMDADLAPLLLYLQYLSQLEGAFWKKIRKNSYGYNIIPKPNEGSITFSLYRATNIFEAYNDARTITLQQLEQGQQFDNTLLESARSSIIFEIIEREKTVGDVIQQAILNSFKLYQTQDPSMIIKYNRHLVDQISNITIEELRRIGEKYLAKMFQPHADGQSKIVIVCHPDKVDAIAQQFFEVGHILKRCSSLECSMLNSCSISA